MCMSSVLKGRDEPLKRRPKKIVRRYKVVDKQCVSPYYESKLTNSWKKAHVDKILYRITHRSADQYLSGFHVFVTRDDAEIWRDETLGSEENYDIVEVDCGGLLAKGFQRVYIENEGNTYYPVQTATEVYQWIKLAEGEACV